MFAIFEKIDCLDWNAFSINYRNSPYFCLNINKQILDKCNAEFPFFENEDLEPVCKNDDRILVYFNALPKKQYAKRLKTSMWKELFKQINSLTLAVLEEEILGKLEEGLRHKRSETTSSIWSWIDQRIFFFLC